MNDTKLKIIEAAERLIARQGYNATSLRQVIGEAGVNLAAIHYHFGSKEELLGAIVARKAEPVNARRMILLDAVQQTAGGGSAHLAAILEAFLMPMADAASD